MDDAALLSAWCDGDREAGDRLLRSAFPRLYRFLFNKVGDDTGEIVQQTMLACVEHRDRVRECVNFEAYLLRMARNKLYDFLRKQGRSREELRGELPSVRDLGTSVASLLGREQRETEVLTTLRLLPIDLQVVLELHYWSELSTAEIADVIEVPVGTVKSRLRRARERFEAIVSESNGSASLELVGTVRP
ncbi:MAG: RNA polymerase sigma factor [Nannocystaceae bacterium]|nr:RNA polymerase sigma factor [Nannocystaceae bacterium]